MRNANEPASPIENTSDFHPGLTKHELFCLHMGIDETGDPDLDDVIRKGERKRLSGLAMQAAIMGRPNIDYDEAADHAINHADALLVELEKPQ